KNDHDEIQEDLKTLGEGESQKQKAGRKPSHHGYQQLDPHKAIGQTFVDEAGKKASDPHGEQVAADHGGKLKNAVPHQIAGHGAGDQLIDQPAGGDQQDRDEKKY